MPSDGPSPIGIAAISASRIRRAGCGWGGSALLPPGGAPGPLSNHALMAVITRGNFAPRFWPFCGYRMKSSGAYRSMASRKSWAAPWISLTSWVSTKQREPLSIMARVWSGLRPRPPRAESDFRMAASARSLAATTFHAPGQPFQNNQLKQE